MPSYISVGRWRRTRTKLLQNSSLPAGAPRTMSTGARTSLPSIMKFGVNPVATCSDMVEQHLLLVRPNHAEYRRQLSLTFDSTSGGTSSPFHFRRPVWDGRDLADFDRLAKFSEQFALKLSSLMADDFFRHS